MLILDKKGGRGPVDVGDCLIHIGFDNRENRAKQFLTHQGISILEI
jgi:hypothetical protein